MKTVEHHGAAERRLMAVMIGLILFKLWLVGAQTMQAIGPSGHDDRLFLKMAGHILRFDWLGSYSHMTLAKGPFYSLFVADAFLLGLPLMTAQHLLYALACVVVIRALKPWAFGFLMQTGLFAALLFNPVTYDMSVHGRVLRQNVTPALSLFILAALIALHARREKPVRQLAPWAWLLGAAMAAFYLTREDGVWIAPALLLPWAATAWLIGRDRHRDRLPRLGVVIIAPLAVCAAGVFTVCALNWHRYGIFTTCEFRHPAFKAAYGSLTRVKPAVWQPYVPVARETRERLYAVSPAFAELRPQLEGQLGSDWAALSRLSTGLPLGDLEIGGGWFMWALRDAVAGAGHTHTGAEAMAFYTRLAKEVNTACDQGLIKAGPARSGFLPPWNPGYNDHLVSAVQKGTASLFTFAELSVTPRPSAGSPESLQLFADLTHERLSPAKGEPPFLPGQAILNKVRLSILGLIGRAYGVSMPLLGLGALLCALAGSIRDMRRRRLPYWGLFSAGLLGSCLALVLICALVDTTSFPAIGPIYLTGGYGFFVFFVFTGMWMACRRPDGPGDTEPFGLFPPLQKAFEWLCRTSAPLMQNLTSARPLPWLLIFLTACASFLPLVLFRAEFHDLFWFGDEWGQLDDISTHGFWTWVWGFFGENFAPLFKLSWGSAVYMSGGSYFFMIVFVWSIHAINVLLLGAWMRKSDFGWLSTWVTTAVFGLAWSNIETLGWTVQLLTVQGMALFMAAAIYIEHAQLTRNPFRWSGTLTTVGLLMASTLSFVRGVLTGPSAGMTELLLPQTPGTPWRPRLRAACICLLPTLVIAVVVAKVSLSIHKPVVHQSSFLLDSLVYTVWYFFLNPFSRLLLIENLNWTVVCLVGFSKLAILGAGWWQATPRQRRLLFTLLLFDLGTACLLGPGRHDMGLGTSQSSRYQYTSLICTLPFAGLALEFFLLRLVHGPRLRWALGTLLVLVLAYDAAKPWKHKMASWSGWRGRETRERLLVDPNPPATGAVPGIPFITTKRAKELINIYDLK